MGKRVGTDLLDGNPSLPIVWGLDLPAVRRAFKSEGCTEELASDAISALLEAGIPARVREAAVAHAVSANEILNTIPDSPYRDKLSALVGDLVDRQV
jgi:geranylgeranyl pyrophosphate synthase